jgi:glycosyltransferase involved in cell wall biosynthesis
MTNEFRSAQIPGPLVSIITVVLNDVDKIRGTLEATLEQNCDDYELIVIDGASTDGTQLILAEYRDRIATLISEPDEGLYDAMRKGAELANGVYTIFMNSGDRFADPRVIGDFKLFKDKSDLVYGSFIRVEEDGRERFEATEPISELWKRVVFCHQSLFARTEIVRQFPFDARYRIAGDYHFYTRCLRKGYTFKEMDRVVSRFLVGGLSHTNFHESTWERYKISRSTFTDKPVTLYYTYYTLRHYYRLLNAKIRGRRKATVWSEQNPLARALEKAIGHNRVGDSFAAVHECYAALFENNRFVPPKTRPQRLSTETLQSIAAAFKEDCNQEAAALRLQSIYCEDFMAKLLLMLERNQDVNKVAIWGAGDYGRRATGFLKSHGLNPVYYIDSNEKRHGEKFCGLPIISPAELKQIRFHSCAPAVVIASDHHAEIAESLEEMNFRCNEDFIS